MQNFPPYCPYPGLRPYDREYAPFFFGRSKHVTDLLTRLHENRLLAIVGESGCGKSSLVRAGLIPALEAGMLHTGRREWTFAIMRPGTAPIQTLADALHRSGILSADDSDEGVTPDFIAPFLKDGPRSLAKLLRLNAIASQRNLLIVVDQFEELFRFEQSGGGEESREFIELLLETAIQADVSAYVVLTMRSDYLGQCPRFLGLPEALSKAQFLTPRLSREEVRQAIEFPAQMKGVAVRREVVNLLLNEMSAEADQLPRLIHVLSRMWREAHVRVTSLPVNSEAFPRDIPFKELTLADYEAAGRFESALRNHANKIFTDVTTQYEGSGPVIEGLFRLLTEVTESGLRVRRTPVRTFGEIQSILGVEPGVLSRIIDRYSAEGRSFLTFRSDEVCAGLDDTPVDLTHETIIRAWPALDQWTQDQADKERIVREMSVDAIAWQQGGCHIDDAVLSPQRRDAAERLRTAGPTVKLPPSLDDYLRACAERTDRLHRDRERLRSIKRRLRALAGVVFVLLLLAAMYRKDSQEKAEHLMYKHLASAERSIFDGDNSAALVWQVEAFQESSPKNSEEHLLRIGTTLDLAIKPDAIWRYPDPWRIVATIPSPVDVARRLHIVRNDEGGGRTYHLQVFDHHNYSSNHPFTVERNATPLKHDDGFPIVAVWSHDGRQAASLTVSRNEWTATLWQIEGETCTAIGKVSYMPDHKGWKPLSSSLVFEPQRQHEVVFLAEESSSPSGEGSVYKADFEDANRKDSFQKLNFGSNSDGDSQPTFKFLHATLNSSHVLALTDVPSWRGRLVDVANPDQSRTVGPSDETRETGYDGESDPPTFAATDHLVAFAVPDNGGGKTRVDFYDLRRVSRQPIGSLESRSRRLTGMCFSQNGTLLQTTGSDKCVQVWKVDSPDGSHHSSEASLPMGDGQMTQPSRFASLLHAFHLAHEVDDATFAPDCESLVVSTRDRAIWVWNLETGALRLPRIDVGTRVDRLHVSASANGPETIVIAKSRVFKWPLYYGNESRGVLDGESLRRLNSDDQFDVRFIDGPSGSRRLRIYDTRKTSSVNNGPFCLRDTVKVDRRPRAAAAYASKDGVVVLVSYEDESKRSQLWLSRLLNANAEADADADADENTNQPLVRTYHTTLRIVSALVSDNADNIAIAGNHLSGDHQGEWQLEIARFDVREQRFITVASPAIERNDHENKTSGFVGGVNYMTLNNAGTSLVVCGGRPKAGVFKEGVALVAPIESNQTNFTRLWHKAKPGTSQNDDFDALLGAAYSNDERTFLATAGEENSVFIWDLSDASTPFLVATLEGHAMDVSHVVFSPEKPSTWLATAGVDGMVLLWPWSEIKAKRLHGKKFPDERDQVSAISVTRSKLVHEGKTARLVFSEDGKLLACTSHYGSTRVWYLGSGQPRDHNFVNLFRHGDDVRSVTLEKVSDTAGYRLLVIYGERNGAAKWRSWKLPFCSAESSSLLNDARRISGRELSSEKESLNLLDEEALEEVWGNRQ